MSSGCGMALRVVARVGAADGEVRLGLRPVVEDDGRRDANEQVRVRRERGAATGCNR